MKTLCNAYYGNIKGNNWIKELLEWYEGRNFILSDGKLNTKPNTEIITKITTKYYDCKCENKYQELISGNIDIYTHDVFCAKDWRTGEIIITDNTYTIHNFAGSWIIDKDRKYLKRKKL